MFALRRETDYALRLLKALATAKSGRTSLATVADATGISFLFLQKIARKLRLAGFIKSAKGVAGGYELKIKPADLSLRRIIAVVEGGCALWACCDKTRGCPVDNCSVRRSASKINKKVMKFLDEVKLTDF